MCGCSRLIVTVAATVAKTLDAAIKTSFCLGASFERQVIRVLADQGVSILVGGKGCTVLTLAITFTIDNLILRLAMGSGNLGHRG